MGRPVPFPQSCVMRMISSRDWLLNVLNGFTMPNDMTPRAYQVALLRFIQDTLNFEQHVQHMYTAADAPSLPAASRSPASPPP